MAHIIIGTTPTIKYKFKIVDPADFAEAIFTIRDGLRHERLRKTLDTATIGTNSIEWTLTQQETLSLATDKPLTMMLNWLTSGGTRGASMEESVTIADNHIREVMT